MSKKFNLVALIPARSGSKRLKNKNILKLNGKPLIAHTINYAKKAKIFDKIILSTESKKYAEIGKKYGAEVPVLRKKKPQTNKNLFKNSFFNLISPSEKSDVLIILSKSILICSVI